VEDQPIKPTKPTKPVAPKAPSATSAPKVPNSATAPKVPSATSVPKAPNNAQNANISAEQAKQAEIQSAMQGAKGGKDPKKKRTVRKLLFLLILLLLISAIAVTATVVIPMVLNNGSNKEITVNIDEGMAYDDGIIYKFSDEVKDYNMGDKIERGLTVRNNGAGNVFVCFKIEIYEKDQEDTSFPINMTATPTTNDSIWSVGSINEEINNTGKTATTKYYYLNNVLQKKSGTTNTATLFREYVVEAGTDITNQYANKSVTVKVTIKFVNADVNSLNSQTDACWNSAPETWKGIMRKATAK